MQHKAYQMYNFAPNNQASSLATTAAKVYNIGSDQNG